MKQGIYAASLFQKVVERSKVSSSGIVGINKLSPKPRKILQLLRLRQLHNGVFLKVNKPIINMLKYIAPYVTFGYPNLKTVRDELVPRRYSVCESQYHFFYAFY